MEIYEHSFVKQLKTFIVNSVDLSYSLNLPADTFWWNTLVFRVQHQRSKYDNIVDFEPDSVAVTNSNDWSSITLCLNHHLTCVRSSVLHLSLWRTV